MRRLIFLVALISGFSFVAWRPALATFSIVAYDPETGQFGAAVTSRAIAVGNRVSWVRAGVGAVCTQASTNAAWGPRALNLLEKEISPEKVVAELVAQDDHPDSRQLGIIDKHGRSAGWRGKWNPAYAGIMRGENYQVQGNILDGEQVLEAMGETFSNTEGELSHRLICALEAGMAAGGDARGRQSAALLVSGTEPDRYGYVLHLWDIRVDEHPYPEREVRRIYRYNKAMEKVWAIRAGDPNEAVKELDKIAAEFPEQALVHYRRACYLSLAGRMDESVLALVHCLRLHPTYTLGAGNSVRLEKQMKEVWTRLYEMGPESLGLQLPDYKGLYARE